MKSDRLRQKNKEKGKNAADFSARVYAVLRRIPKGRVMTYAGVAKAIGSPRAARAVGNALNRNPNPGDAVPCHRVVKSDGRVGGYVFGEDKKEKLLLEEGVEVVDGRVDLNRFQI